MYIMNRRPQSKHRVRSILVALSIVGVLGGLSVGAWRYADADTSISATPPPVVSKVLGAKSKTKSFSAGPVSIDLPQDWEVYTPTSAPAGTTSWRNTASNKGVRSITLYIDSFPQDFAVNRILAVESVENRVTAVGNVSDNCVNFSGQSREATSGSGKSPARWEGVEFTCDTGNYVRNVVGISSVATPGAVKLTSASGASRQVSLTYTDSGASPNHTIFTVAIESLRLL